MSSPTNNPQGRPNPSLVIGLGGTGILSVIQLKDQLWNMYDRKIPEEVGLLGFDTDRDPLKQFVDNPQRLESHEFGHLGAVNGRIDSVKPWVKTIADASLAKSESMQYLTSWLQANWYLENLSDSLFFLDKGAGQFRQLGRLAVFKDVVNEGQSGFYTRVKRSIQQIRNANRTAQSINAYIVCSIAGGTGAGTVIDVAYLVRKIAQEVANFKVALRAIIVLPQAFEGTLPDSQRESARVRSYAALRELNRFLMNEDWGDGYPIRFHAPADKQTTAIWNSSLTSKLFDFVYLVDGIRAYLPLQQLATRVGVGPSISDAILAMIDSNAGGFLDSNMTNMGNAIADARINQGRIPFVSSFGTYSVILPIHQIIDKWGYQLAYDTVKLLTSPDEATIDPNTKTPRSVSPHENQEQPNTKTDEMVTRILKERQDFYDVDDQTIRAKPTALWPELQRMFESYQNTESAYIRQLQRYTFEQWVRILEPDSDSLDEKGKRALRELKKEALRTMKTEVLTTKAIDNGEDYCRGVERMVVKAEGVLDGQIGLVRGGGGRAGGSYQRIAETLRILQFDAFKSVMQLFLKMHLNGQDVSAAPIRSRAGKIGWLSAVLSELDKRVDEIYNLLLHVREGDSERISPRTQALTNYESSKTNMREKCSEGGNFLRNPALQAQEQFVTVGDELLSAYRAIIIRDELTLLVKLMRDYIRGANKSLSDWLQVLVYDQSGLLAITKNGQDQITTQRMTAEKVASRDVINDKDWEDKRYAYYSQSQNTSAVAMSAFRWEVKQGQDQNGNESARINLFMNDKPLIVDRQSSQSWAKTNLDIILEFCRGVFRPALTAESVLSYLMGKYDADQLGEKLNQSSGALLQWDANGVTGRGVQATVSNLLLAYNGGKPEEQQFRDGILERLRNIRGGGATDATQFQEISCDDRFRLTVVNFNDVLPVSEMTSVERNRQSYLQAPLERRVIQHLFAAEINTVKYEERMESDLHQERRVLQDRISVLMEDREKFVNFLTMVAFGQVSIELDQRGKQQSDRNWYMWVVVAPKVSNPNELEEWWLTEPTQEPSLLDAMMTYLYLRKDVGQKIYTPGYANRINYEQIVVYMQKLKRIRAKKAFFADEIGQQREELATWLETLAGLTGLSGDARQTAQKSAYERDEVKSFAVAAVECEVLLQLAENMMSEVVSTKRALDGIRAEGTPNRKREQNFQELYDLYSLGVMVVREEAETKFATARQLAGKNQTFNTGGQNPPPALGGKNKPAAPTRLAAVEDE